MRFSKLAIIYGYLLINTFKFNILNFSVYLDRGRTVFFLRKKSVRKRIFKGRSYFLKEKSTIFLSKKHARPDRFSPRTFFERSEKQTVRKTLLFISRSSLLMLDT